MSILCAFSHALNLDFSRDTLVRTIAIVNQKGGCGKTTTAINLAAICAKRGLRTLVVDMDPQSHCAAGLGVPDDALQHSIGAAMLRSSSATLDHSSLVWEVSRNLDLAPSTMSLAGLEAPGGGLHDLEDRDRRLCGVLRKLAPHYDRCLIDCPPNVGLLTYNALRAAGEAIIPVQTEFFALKGAARQCETIKNLVESVNHPIACYVLPTLFNQEEEIACDILAKIKAEFGGRVLPLVIRECVEIREAATFGQPVTEYAPDADAVKDFEALADWLEEHPADPPEIQVEVTRCITVPYGPPEPVEDDPDDTHLTSREPSTTGTAAAHAPPSPAIEGRAAEMARRVRQLSMARTGSTETEPEATPATERNDRPVHPLRESEPAQAEVVIPKTNIIRSAIDASLMASHRRAVLIEQKELPDSVHAVRSNVVRLFGARQTSQGVLFIQPGGSELTISIAGTFNNWSATATTLRYNRDTGVHELLLPLETGEHEYRLVINGRWQADPYNSQRRRNDFGEDNCFIVVT